MINNTLHHCRDGEQLPGCRVVGRQITVNRKKCLCDDEIVLYSDYDGDYMNLHEIKCDSAIHQKEIIIKVHVKICVN